MGTKVQELDNLKSGDRLSCPICNPSKRLVREDQVWTWQKNHPQESVWKV